jgi:hypothetical protein
MVRARGRARAPPAFRCGRRGRRERGQLPRRGAAAPSRPPRSNPDRHPRPAAPAGYRPHGPVLPQGGDHRAPRQEVRRRAARHNGGAEAGDQVRGAPGRSRGSLVAARAVTAISTPTTPTVAALRLARPPCRASPAPRPRPPPPPRREAFDLFDTDGSGTIDAKELKVAMRCVYALNGAAARCLSPRAPPPRPRAPSASPRPPPHPTPPQRARLRAQEGGGQEDDCRGRRRGRGRGDL